ncbi:hypothetical protein [Acinetobacter sp. CFCC 10889]|nr:hypothetical protein [Acinetobacter sp. CFCC 10889]
MALSFFGFDRFDKLNVIQNNAMNITIFRTIDLDFATAQQM